MVFKVNGNLVLPEKTTADNPLLAVMWARLQEGCRLLFASGTITLHKLSQISRLRRIQCLAVPTLSMGVQSSSNLLVWKFLKSSVEVLRLHRAGSRKN